MGTLDEDARDLLLLVGLVVADRACWTRHARAAHRWKHRAAKPERWVDGEASTDKAAVDRNSGTWSRISCNPRDRRATEWSVMGALEFCAEDPNGQDVIRALDLLLEVGRGWTISRIEELGHEVDAVDDRGGGHENPRAEPVTEKGSGVEEAESCGRPQL